MVICKHDGYHNIAIFGSDVSTHPAKIKFPTENLRSERNFVLVGEEGVNMVIEYLYYDGDENGA
jgi:hypothetical protein